MRFEDIDFLGQGRFTKIDDTVRYLARKIARRSDGNSSLRNISDYLREEMVFAPKSKSAEFRKRSASEILISRHYTGCTDIALVFAILSRARGIPSRYVETFKEKWLNDKNARGIHGHIFVDILDGKEWRAYEPLRGFTKDGDYCLCGEKFSEVGKGLDFSEVYIKEDGVYRDEPVNLQNLDLAVKLFKKA